MNGLSRRVKNKDLEKFYSQVDKLHPDVISLQEIMFRELYILRIMLL
jgi:hypothetical protein